MVVQTGFADRDQLPAGLKSPLPEPPLKGRKQAHWQETILTSG
ncbi:MULTISPECIES: hypothetical protein [Xenorhabdus]|nr:MULTISPECIES: hypothetical protein [Xenorhabdus]